MAEATTTCSTDGCNNKLRIVGKPRKLKHAASMCKVHYKRVQITGDPFKSLCACGCRELVAIYANEEISVYADGHDAPGYTHIRTKEDCTAPGCDKPVAAKQHCRKHYQRLRTTGSLELDPSRRLRPKPKKHQPTAEERKAERAQKALALVQQNIRPQLGRGQVEALNWLLIKTDQRWCGNCLSIQSIEQFSERRANGEPFGWTNTCKPCVCNRQLEWRSTKGQHKHTYTCSVCGQQYSTWRKARKNVNCCSQNCGQKVGSAASQALTVQEALRKKQSRRCKHCLGSIDVSKPLTAKYCDTGCRDAAAKQRALELRSPLRKAIEEWDYDAMVQALLNKVTIEGAFDCWSWPTTCKDGYSRSSSVRQLYRRVLEVKHGKPLGSQAAHHTCHNRACVKPDHLQPVTHIENSAEMLAHTSHIKFQQEALSIIRSLAPDHPFLNRIELI
jgi:hypothetical protein